jgi:hypothetical protein
MIKQVRRWLLGSVLFVSMVAVPWGAALRASELVTFDVNPVVVARDMGQSGIMSQLPNSRHVDVQMDVSAILSPGADSRVTEYTVRILSRHEQVQVADFSPRTELYSDVIGPMQVTQDSDRNREWALRGIGGYPGVGTVQGYAYDHDRSHETVVYARKPSMELSMASGTLARRRGVYFKVRQSPQATLEGSRPLRIVFEVPQNWRADLLDVAIEAVGHESAHSKRVRVLSTQRFVVAMYQEFDTHAAQTVTNYMRQQERLTAFARNFATTIEQQSYPTPFHKLGAKLDIYEPNIPQDWYASIVFQPGTAYPMLKLAQLPVDLRVAILNYLDQKELVETMSGASSPSRTANLRQDSFVHR